MTSDGVVLLATLAVRTIVRGTGRDRPRSKFSRPNGAWGRQISTRFPKNKHRDHFREEATGAKRDPKSRQETCAQEKYQHRRVRTTANKARKELQGVATSFAANTQQYQARPTRSRELRGVATWRSAAREPQLQDQEYHGPESTTNSSPNDKSQMKTTNKSHPTRSAQ